MTGGSQLKTLNFAIVGCGFIASKHIKAIKNMPDCHLAAVYDVNLKAARELAHLTGALVYRNYDELIQNDSIHVVIICTPANLHVPLGIKAAAHGKHLLIEKPLAVSLEDADILIEACQRAGVILATVHQHRYKAPVKALKRAITQGELGTISHGSAVLRWNRNMDYYTQKPWRGDPLMGGGVLLNQAIHNIDLLQWMLGPVNRVYGQTASSILPIKGEETVIAVLQFASGALGLVEACSSVYPENLEETLSIFGSKGTVILSGKSISQVKRWDLASEVAKPEDYAVDPADPGGYIPVFADLVQCIRTGHNPMVSAQEGRKTLEIIMAIKDAHLNGKPIELPLKS